MERDENRGGDVNHEKVEYHRRCRESPFSLAANGGVRVWIVSLIYGEWGRLHSDFQEIVHPPYLDKRRAGSGHLQRVWRMWIETPVFYRLSYLAAVLRVHFLAGRALFYGRAVSISWSDLWSLSYLWPPSPVSSL